jgi:formylglycine-generating enzyme required for sulfatase activity
LVQILATRFDKEELRAFCFELGVGYDDLPAEGNAGKARELVGYFDRRGHISDVIEAGERLRSDIPWNDIFEVPNMVLISAGPFWLGSPDDDPEADGNEMPQLKLPLREYRIGRYPVTNAQYASFVFDSGHNLPDHWEQGKIPNGMEDHPVVNVSFDDAEAYCRWLSQITKKHYCLPTEEEWEKAARGGLPETRRYPWGDEWQPGLCNMQELGRNGTTSVDEFEQVNSSPFGVVDMAGNVWEWTASWYKAYPGSTRKSERYGRVYRVVRGGSWRSQCRAARISCRGRYEPDDKRPHVGFRIASD